MIVVETSCQSLRHVSVITGPPQTHLADCLARSPDPPGPGDVHDHTNLTQTLLEIQERFRQTLYLCSADQLAFLQQAAGFQEGPLDWTEEADAAFKRFKALFFVFLFKDHKTYHLVLPVELAKILKEVLENPDFDTKNARYLKRIRYVKALIILCGAYEIDHLVAAWNQHHLKRTNVHKARIFLNTLAAFDRSFTLLRDEIFDQSLDPYEARNLLNATFDKPCRLPTQELVDHLAKTGYDPGDAKARQTLKAFLQPFFAHAHQLEALMVQLALRARRTLDPQAIKQDLKRDQLPVDDPAFVQAFEPLYDRWQQSIRVWELRGDSRGQLAFETGEPSSSFQLPKEKRKNNQRLTSS